MVALILALFLPLLPSQALADEPEEGQGNQPKVIYRQKSAVSFDDRVVEGSTNNPEGVYVVTPPEKKFGSLLKLRPNFHRELVRDSLLMK